MLKEEEVDKKYFIDGDVLKCLNAWEEMIKIFDVDEKISPVIMINEHYNNHPAQNKIPGLHECISRTGRSTPHSNHLPYSARNLAKN